MTQSRSVAPALFVFLYKLIGNYDGLTNIGVNL